MGRLSFFLHQAQEREREREREREGGGGTGKQTDRQTKQSDRVHVHPPLQTFLEVKNSPHRFTLWLSLKRLATDKQQITPHKTVPHCWFISPSLQQSYASWSSDTEPTSTSGKWERTPQIMTSKQQTLLPPLARLCVALFPW